MTAVFANQSFWEKDYSHSLRRRWTPFAGIHVCRVGKSVLGLNVAWLVDLWSTQLYERQCIHGSVYLLICSRHVLLRLFLCSGNCQRIQWSIERSRFPAPVELTFSGWGEREGAESDKISLEKYYSVVKDQLGDWSKKVTFQLRRECHESPAQVNM